MIAISAGILASGIANVFNLESYLQYGFFAFFSTLCVYNGQRVVKANTETTSPWLKWVGEHTRLTIALSIISGLIGAYFFIRLLNDVMPLVLLPMGVAVIISVYYVVRMGGRNLRELPHLKIHAIAFTWTVIMVVFPIINEQLNEWEVFKFFIPAHYIYFIAVAIPFDIRDLKHDSPSQRTIPQVVGIRNAKIISIVLLVLVCALIGAISSFSLLRPLFVCAFLIQIFLIAFSSNKTDFYYSIFIDGAIAILGLSYLAK
ncbi:hypothetical protein [Flagellimonas myxillae]|uniref:hypothetical protein n=1 Tax=Flagellimonas myxillae TaxID=2942214 RepID=UPI00201F911E|nr:hypothetical protein [Muricauda myxillae]MCL6266917.1 hypothetical protein [Muricauda myxillae]